MLSYFVKAFYAPKVKSHLHYHKERTEDYYIISGKAKVIVDTKEHYLRASSHLKVLPNQQHQVLNESDIDGLCLIVKCSPAWIPQDFNLVTHQNEATNIFIKSRF